MANSGSTSIQVTAYDTLKFSWEIASQSIANNTTTVSWKMELVAGSSGAINSTVSKSWSVTVNGTKYSGTNTVGIANNATKTLASGSTTIPHNSDGTKTFSYTFSQTFGITFSGASVGTKSGSGSGTLTTIPRKSTMTVGSGTLGVAQTLTINKKATSFTHTIKYVSGSYSATIAEKSTATSISWTPPLTLASGAPNGTRVYVTFTIETFNGTASLGSNTYSIWCNIPDGVSPSVSFTVTDPLGYLSEYGVYVQGKSKFKIAVTASGTSGSTIASYKVVADGKTYTSANVETDAISGSGRMTLTVTVTDSRGRTASASKTVDVIEYAQPKITAMTIKRSNSSGGSNSGGAYLTVTFSTSLSSIDGKNSALYQVKYKKKTASSYSTATVSAYTNIFAVSSGTYTFSADTASSYDVILVASDDFGSVEKSGTGASITKIFSLLAKGLGMGIGKVAELENTLEIAFETLFHKSVCLKNTMAVYSENSGGTRRNILHLNQSNFCNLGYGGYVANEGATNVYGNEVGFLSKNGFTFNGTTLDDFVVEEGTSGIWTYRKWNSGIAEVWGKYSISNLACTTALGNMYRTAVFQPNSFPFTLSGVYVFADYESAGYGAFLWATTNSTTSSPPSYYLVRPTSTTISSGTVKLYAKGNWK